MKLSALIYPALYLLAICGAVMPASGASGNIHRFGTYNIRYMNKEDNVADDFHSWHNRYQKVPELILKYDFDVIGIQEVTGYNNGDQQRINSATGKSQLDDMTDALSDYTILSWEREGKDYQYKLIAFKTEKYDLLDQGWIGLSPSGKLGADGWDPALYPIRRRAGWAKLRDKATNETFVFCVTHMNYGASLDGIYGNRLLGEKLSEIAGELPVVLVGDFNMRRKDHETAYRGVAAYLEDSRLIADVNECWPAENGQTEYTAVQWTTMANPSKLKGSEFDYVFTRNIKVKERHILTDYYMFNGEPANPSDHFPILTLCTLGDPRPAQTWCVSPDGSDDGDGSADAPFRTIAKAVGTAYTRDEIRLAAGTYSEAVVLDKSLTIAGGYDSSFTIADGVSVLDAGSTSGTILSVPKYYNLTLNNLTLRNCVNTTSSSEGAVYFCGNTLKMTKVTFENNSAFQTGGALWAKCNEIDATDCVFRNNSAKVSGGAVWYNNWADARFERCEFSGNSAPIGAAVYATSDETDASHIEFTCARNIFDGCTFSANSCTKNGTICLDGKLPNIRSVLINSTLANNMLTAPAGMASLTKKYGGSAISATLTDKGTHNCSNSTLEMAHCSVIANHDSFKGSNKANFGGGAIRTSGGTTRLINNIFLYNTTEASAGYADCAADNGAHSNHNIFSGPGSTQCSIGTGSLQVTPAEAAELISTEQSDGRTLAVLTSYEGYCPGVELKSPMLGNTDLRFIDARQRDVEQAFGIDLNGDGMSSDILARDQFGRMRQTKSVPGAVEYSATGAVALTREDSRTQVLTPAGINRYLVEGDTPWTVYALDGRMAKTGSSRVLDLSDCNAGIYILRIGSRTVKLAVK